ncbi:unnamed protein product [Cylicocyclus nassatus]|uniref:CNNM transmembrane domain-containing protein n=1 Tax=Cylicocyclus nassatus TaxID=53992 RepID=A0AA36GUL8_CYLNA|nr:unnamed protein product [Cylicocyclus nassatus]
MRWLLNAFVGLLFELPPAEQVQVKASSTMGSASSGAATTRESSLTFTSTSVYSPATKSSKNNSTTASLLLAMSAYYDKYDRPQLRHLDDEIVVVGENLNVVIKIWLHTSPACHTIEDSRMVELKILKISTHYVTAIRTRDEARGEFLFPLYVCTEPKSTSDFNSVVIHLRDRVVRGLILIYCVFLFLSALFTGLNLSLMSLDMEDLRRISEYDENPKTRKYAANIIPIRENGNFTLCTIILGNTICNAVVVLTFERITHDLDLTEWQRILLIEVVPSLLIIIFSEVIPQVICTKFALPIGSRCRRIMVFFMVLTYPASYPLSLLLDCVVGKEVRITMDRHMLGSLMRQQKYDTAKMADVIENAMMLEVRRVKDVMTPLDKVFMISEETEINLKLKQQLKEFRHTRIPVYKGDKNCVIGVLNVKDLLLVDESLDIHVGAVMQLFNRSTLFRMVTSESPVIQLMVELKRGFPLAIVVDFDPEKKRYSVTGIVTLEDNLEEVIGEIRDEKDVVGQVIEARTEKSGPVDIQAELQTLKKSKKRPLTTGQDEIVSEEKTPLLKSKSKPLTPTISLTKKVL